MCVLCVCMYVCVCVWACIRVCICECILYGCDVCACVCACVRVCCLINIYAHVCMCITVPPRALDETEYEFLMQKLEDKATKERQFKDQQSLDLKHYNVSGFILLPNCVCVCVSVCDV